MAEELKACPFCGGQPDLIGLSRGDAYVRCGQDNCQAESDCFDTDQLAIAAWNRRAKASQGGEAVAWQVVGVHPKHRHPHKVVEYSEKTAEGQAAHWRNRGCTVEITPLYTHPADQVADAARWRYYAPKVAERCGVTLAEMNAEIDEAMLAKP